MSISGKTALYGVIGSPVAHSLSPFIMNRAFAQAGVDGAYAAFDVPPDRVTDAVRGLQALGFCGVNVTYPLKERVVEIAGHRDEAVEVIGAANTLVISRDDISAFNTDAPGTVRAIEGLCGVPVGGRRVLIFGGGGAARAAAWGLLDAGSERVVLAVRRPDAADAAVGRLRGAFPDGSVRAVAWAEADARDFDIVINATPVGMHESGTLVPADHVSESQFYFDFVYHPRDTDFVENARRGGAVASDGLALLVAQAEASFHRWTGRDFSLADMYAAVEAQVETRNKRETKD